LRAWQEVTDAVGKASELLRELLQIGIHPPGVEPVPDGGAQTKIIPPRGMEARPRPQDAFALLECWRQRPRCGYDVRIGEVFQGASGGDVAQFLLAMLARPYPKLVHPPADGSAKFTRVLSILQPQRALSEQNSMMRVCG
jgi:hypothetical protein